MFDAVIQDPIRQQRPYYLPQGNSVNRVGGQYWIIFQHWDADKGGNFLRNIVSLLGFKDKAVPHKVLRIDPIAAKIYTYNPRTPSDLPSPALLRFLLARDLLCPWLVEPSLARRTYVAKSYWGQKTPWRRNDNYSLRLLHSSICNSQLKQIAARRRCRVLGQLCFRSAPQRSQLCSLLSIRRPVPWQFEHFSHQVSFWLWWAITPLPWQLSHLSVVWDPGDIEPFCDMIIESSLSCF
jgi:hypothetical protein